ncbi:DNA polymerase delta small subunit, variant 1 [Capsaspora owczarzaki ATCC 30864]|uniref:DNA polymerase delta small subunit, variant 1 n=1 Tax=Capsaspora owczarzaki (strain ATCC 30864) TaxID=595528 RepID=A0A0D2UEW5_CAPO3|nr:DNA polymerase delta small subunit, variant 1 [Capsaspora owczarzaki ATCC 30864]
MDFWREFYTDFPARIFFVLPSRLARVFPVCPSIWSLYCAISHWCSGLARLLPKTQHKTAAPSFVNQLVHLEIGRRCFAVGTLYKEMTLKPSILKEIAEERDLVPQPPRARYTSDDDFIVLEDSSGRVRLGGNFPSSELVTGDVVAVLGTEQSGGEFVVEEWLMAGPAPQPALDTASRMRGDELDPHVAIVSGLELGKSDQDPLALELLSEFLCGNLGGELNKDLAASVVRVVVAGNSLFNQKELEEASKPKYMARNAVSLGLQTTQQLDSILSNIASTCPVDVMSGPLDPTNHILPQQPLHRCLFPRAYALQTFQTVPNPYHVAVDGVHIMGTSGQPIDDMIKFQIGDDRLALLEHTLQGRHLAPTAPDTLACFPLNADPFILESSPHVYFAANQPEFATSVLKGEDGQSVRLVLIPTFSTTQTIVLLNLVTLECTPVCFRTIP